MPVKYDILIYVSHLGSSSLPSWATRLVTHQGWSPTRRKKECSDQKTYLAKVAQQTWKNILAVLVEIFWGFGGNIFKWLPLFCDAFEEIRYHLTNTKQYKFHQVLYLHRYQIFPPVTMFTWEFRHFANGSLYHLINWWKCPQFLVKAKQFPHWSCFDINFHIYTPFIAVEAESKVSCTNKRGF